jgi:hypothetical protein
MNQTGPNSVVVVLVGFNGTNGDPTPKFPACNESCVVDVLWGARAPTVATMFSQSSFGQFSFDQATSAVVRAVIPVDPNRGSCGMADTWFRAARSASPVNVSTYTARVYLYPSEAGSGTCTASGFSNMGCTKAECNTWLRAFSGNLVLHELGHLANLSHAAFDVNEDGAIDPDTEAAADNSDPMTTDGTWRGFSAASRIQARWMPCMGLPPNTTRMTLASLSAALDPVLTPAALCVVEPLTRILFVVSLRTPAGPDMALGPPWVNAVYVHTLASKGQGTARARLAPGDTYAYVNETTGLDLAVTVVAVDPVSHTAEISFEPCVRGVPLLEPVPTAPIPTLRVVSTDLRCGHRSFTARVVAVSDQSALGCVNVTLVLRKDASPREMSAVMVVNATGEILLAIPSYSEVGPAMTRSVLYCGMDVGTDAVTVVVRDSQGDGYCCQWGPGGYAILVNGVVVKTGGEFAFEENTTVSNAPRW